MESDANNESRRDYMFIENNLKKRNPIGVQQDGINSNQNSSLLE